MNINPLCTLTEPLDIVTALLLSLIKSTGEITKEQKMLLITVLSKNFSVSAQEASDSFAQVSFLMRDAIDITAILSQMLAPIKGSSQAQILSLNQMMTDVVTENHTVTPNEYQNTLINKVMSFLQHQDKQIPA